MRAFRAVQSLLPILHCPYLSTKQDFQGPNTKLHDFPWPVRTLNIFFFGKKTSNPEQAWLIRPALSLW